MPTIGGFNDPIAIFGQLVNLVNPIVGNPLVEGNLTFTPAQALANEVAHGVRTGAVDVMEAQVAMNVLEARGELNLASKIAAAIAETGQAAKFTAFTGRALSILFSLPVAVLLNVFIDTTPANAGEDATIQGPGYWAEFGYAPFIAEAAALSMIDMPSGRFNTNPGRIGGANSVTFGWTETSQLFGLGKGSSGDGAPSTSNGGIGAGGETGVTGVDSGTGDGPGGTPDGGQAI